jgi:peptide/nickel transport system permease protein
MRYTIHRLCLGLVTFVGITLVTFSVIQLAPGDPIASRVEPEMGPAFSQETYDRLRAHWGLNQPISTQYWRWLKRLVTLDFGNSLIDQRPVWDKIAERLPWTVALSTISILLSLLISIPTGVLSAVRRAKRFDTLVGTGFLAIYSIPGYVTGMVLLVAVTHIPIEWIPISGVQSDDFESLSLWGKIADLFKHFLLITICFTYPLLAFQSRFVRGNMLEVIGQDYMRTARAKGLSERSVIWRHGVRNSLIPLITLIGLMLPSIVSGSVILEVMFQWPGVGRLMYEAMTQRDYFTVMGVSTMAAVVVLVGTLLSDLAYAWADPRVRYDR